MCYGFNYTIDLLHDKAEKALDIVVPYKSRLEAQSGSFFDSFIGSQVDQPCHNGHSLVIEVIVISIGMLSNTILFTS